METLSLALCIAIGLLMVDSVIELAFVSSTFAWLNGRCAGAFSVDYSGGTFALHGKPAYLYTDTGLTAYGAAGTAFVLVGLGGILALCVRDRADRTSFGLRTCTLAWYFFWIFLNILSMLLALGALIYEMVLETVDGGQSIDIAKAATLNTQTTTYVDAAYPDYWWTPQGWFEAVLRLPLTHSGDMSDIRDHLQIIRAWRWNLVPLFFFSLVVCVLAIVEGLRWRRTTRIRREQLEKKILIT